MKKLFLLLILMFGIKTIEASNTSLTLEASTKSIIKPPTTRNLSVILNYDSLSPYKDDATAVALKEALLSSSPLMTNENLISHIQKQHRMVSDLFNPQITNANILTIYPLFVEKYKFTIDSIKYMRNNLLSLYILIKKQRILPTSVEIEKNLSPANIADYTLLTSYIIVEEKLSKFNAYKTKNENYIFFPKHSPSINYFTLSNDWQEIDLREDIPISSSQSKTHHEHSIGFLDDFIILVTPKKSINLNPFTTLDSTKLALPLNIILTGHGFPDATKTGHIVYPVIGGIDRQVFINLTQLLKQRVMNTQSFFYTTCFGGGSNAEFVFDQTELPYVIIAQGITDTSIQKKLIVPLNTTRLNTYFEFINSNIVTALQTIDFNGILDKDKPKNEFQVRLPGTSWFNLTTIQTKLSDITFNRSITGYINKTTITLKHKHFYTLSTDTLLVPLIFDADNREPIIISHYPFREDGGTYYLKEITLPTFNPDTIRDTLSKIRDIFTRIGTKYIAHNFYIEQLTTGFNSDIVLTDIIVRRNNIFWRDPLTGTFDSIIESKIPPLSDAVIQEKLNAIKAEALRKRNKVLKEMPEWESLQKILTNQSQRSEFEILKDHLTQTSESQTDAQKLSDIVTLQAAIESTKRLTDLERTSLQALAKTKSQEFTSEQKKTIQYLIDMMPYKLIAKLKKWLETSFNQ
jgi:hypothetical protein